MPLAMAKGGCYDENSRPESPSRWVRDIDLEGLLL